VFDRELALLVALLAIAAVAFALGLWSLGQRDDVSALVLLVLGATAARGVAQALRALERRAP